MHCRLIASMLTAASLRPKSVAKIAIAHHDCRADVVAEVKLIWIDQHRMLRIGGSKSVMALRGFLLL